MPPPVSVKLMLHMGGVHVGPDAQNAAALHRFEAVLDHVVKDLLHLVAIELEQRQIGTQFLSRPRCRDPRFPAAKKRTASSTIALMFSGWSCGFEGRIARRNCVTIESSRVISARAMSIDSCSSSCRFSIEFAHLPLHQLQMDVQRIERIADFMRHARGQQRERIEALRLDRFFGRAPAFRDIAQDDGVSDRLGAARPSALPLSLGMRRSMMSGTT